MKMAIYNQKTNRTSLSDMKFKGGITLTVLFCNKVIVVNVKLATGHPFTTFLRKMCTANRSCQAVQCLHGDVHVLILWPLFEQLLHL